MPITIQEFKESMVPSVVAFNERLAEGKLRWRLPTSPGPNWLPRLPDSTIFRQLFLALDETATVRGGYCIKHQDYRIGDGVRSIGQIALPLSEGIVDRHYAQVGAQLLLHAIHQQPFLYALGMGGQDESITNLVRAARWRVITLPFYFRVLRPFVFLRNVRILRRSSLRRLALDGLALSGLGWLGCKAVNLVLSCAAPSQRGLTVEQVDEFSDWADDVWQASAPEYPYSAVRDAATLRILYPKDDPRFIRLKISEAGRWIGWAVLLATDLRNHKQFGNMRLGSIVDAFARPADADKIIAVAERLLRSKNVDLIVSNQAHGRWCQALRRCGFLTGPSNFLLATSRKLTELLDTLKITNDSLYLNRGDGDGPINL